MGKSNFIGYTSSEYQCDPIFEDSQFYMCGNPNQINAPILFVANGYRYVIANPDELLQDVNLKYKVAVYLFHHSRNSLGIPITYFFGDINVCRELSTEFEGIVRIVGVEMVLEWYPQNIGEINQKIVNYFLAQQNYYGQEFEWGIRDRNLLMFIPPMLNSEEQEKNYQYITEQIFANKLFVKTKEMENRIWFVISPDAINKYQESKDNSSNGRKAFIAIKFIDNEERIQSIQRAISSAGYEPVIMNEFETNNWIMPEIFYQIKLAKFVVVDLSIRSDGAYYEAGYAHALGKEVIHLYDKRQEKDNPLHFDVAQKSTIVYEGFEELESKLTARIKATVG